jgi:hypothetical protein
VIALTAPGEQRRLAGELAEEFPLVIPFTVASPAD